MATTNKGLNQPALNSTNWDTPLNANFGYIDAALGGVTTKSVTGVGTTPVVLSLTEYQSLILNFTGTLTANVTYRIPSGVGGQWIVRNATSGSYTLTIDSAGGGTSVVIPSGGQRTAYSDGTNIRFSEDSFSSIPSGSVAYSSGGTLTGTSGLTYNGTVLDVMATTAATNTATEVMILDSQSSGTPAAGIGTTLSFAAETAVGNTETGMQISAVTTDVTSGSEDFDFVLRLMAAGAAPSVAFKVSSTGTAFVSAILDAAGGNTATINGITPAIASQAQAQAGTDNTTLMTPLRTSEAIAALGAGMTLLGTLTTTSGTTQTLSGLTLTNYRQLLFDFNGVSHNNGSSQTVSIGAGLIMSTVSASDVLNGLVFVSLWSGISAPILARSTLPTSPSNNQNVAQTGYSTATTSVSISVSAGPFDAGSVRVYGVK